jgi:hypothetical protein
MEKIKAKSVISNYKNFANLCFFEEINQKYARIPLYNKYIRKGNQETK